MAHQAGRAGDGQGDRPRAAPHGPRQVAVRCAPGARCTWRRRRRRRSPARCSSRPGDGRDRRRASRPRASSARKTSRARPGVIRRRDHRRRARPPTQAVVGGCVTSTGARRRGRRQGDAPSSPAYLDRMINGGPEGRLRLTELLANAYRSNCKMCSCCRPSCWVASRGVGPSNERAADIADSRAGIASPAAAGRCASNFKLLLPGGRRPPPADAYVGDSAVTRAEGGAACERVADRGGRSPWS